MNDEFKRYFSKCLDQFKVSGAKSLQSEIPELIKRTCSVDASKSFLHFVADVCIELKDHHRAIEILKLIESKFQLDDTGYNNLAFCLWELDRKMEAYSAYERSLQLNPSNISSLRGSCFLAIETDHDAEAVEYCGRFIRSVPSDQEAAVWFATALWNAGLAEDLKKFVSQHETDFGPNHELREFLSPNYNSRQTPSSS